MGTAAHEASGQARAGREEAAERERDAAWLRSTVAELKLQMGGGVEELKQELRRANGLVSELQQAQAAENAAMGAGKREGALLAERLAGVEQRCAATSSELDGGMRAEHRSLSVWAAEAKQQLEQLAAAATAAQARPLLRPHPAASHPSRGKALAPARSPSPC